MSRKERQIGLHKWQWQEQ